MLNKLKNLLSKLMKVLTLKFILSKNNVIIRIIKKKYDILVLRLIACSKKVLLRYDPTKPPFPLIIKENEVKRPNVNSEEFIECQALGRIAQRSIDRFYILMLQLWRNEESHISINELEKKCRKISKNLEARHSWLMPEFSEKWTFDLFINHLIEAKFVKKDEKGFVYPLNITNNYNKKHKKF